MFRYIHDHFPNTRREFLNMQKMIAKMLHVPSVSQKVLNGLSTSKSQGDRGNIREVDPQ